MCVLVLSLIPANKPTTELRSGDAAAERRAQPTPAAPPRRRDRLA